MLRRAVVIALVVAGLVGLFVLVGQDAYQRMMAVTSAAAFWVYVLLYGLRSPWWKNVVGRSLMWLALSSTLLLTMISLSFVLGDYPGRDVVRNVAYSTLPVVVVQFTRVLHRVQQGRERGEIPAKVQGDL